nr:class I SAM-dependent methyltransferase [Allorhizobium sonneratiae]
MFDGESLITPNSIAAEIFVAKNTEKRSDDRALAEAELAITLNLIEKMISNENHPSTIMSFTVERLCEMRKKFTPVVWSELIPFIQNNSSAQYFQNDPFTKWSVMKPRGYSGDAQLIDFIYRHESMNNHIVAASELGQCLHGYAMEVSSSVAVRERRDLLTRHIDEMASSYGGELEILTIAAGHLREANRSSALQNAQIKRWIALDQDPLSVGAMRREFAGTCVDPVDGSVRSLLTNQHDLGEFNFVYASGLYDYLNDKVAIKLTRKCLSMLKPNGVFLFANFTEENSNAAYMETYMNWALLMRSEADMWRIIHESCKDMDVDCQVRFGENRNIVYGFIRRKD